MMLHVRTDKLRHSSYETVKSVMVVRALVVDARFDWVQVVIDAFRLINPQTMMLGQEPRQTTSNLGHLEKPSIQVIRVPVK